MKPGIYTTEFWKNLAVQVVAVLVLTGVVKPADEKTLQGACVDAVTGASMVIAAGMSMVAYIKSRATVKQAHAENQLFNGPSGGSPMTAPKSGGLSLFKPTAAVLALLCLPALTMAQAPTPTAFLPWRSQMEQRVQRLEANQHQQAPAAPQTDPAIGQALSQLADSQRRMLDLLQNQHAPAPAAPAPAPAPGPTIPTPRDQIIYYLPKQELPIAGPPLQTLPIPGAPLQQLPISGQPLQPLPVPGQPQQQLPAPGQPLQVLPQNPGPPPQMLPVQPQTAPTVPVVPTPKRPPVDPPVQGVLHLSTARWTPALWRPGTYPNR